MTTVGTASANLAGAGTLAAAGVVKRSGAASLDRHGRAQRGGCAKDVRQRVLDDARLEPADRVHHPVRADQPIHDLDALRDGCAPYADGRGQPHRD